ncbi:protein hunchback-like [Uloborus diversus]|uniref:protein hunchback-like n=1 Tax=Uloborus diversus TaxID=327109 RepID=UPI002409949F|nr:protein hunchback-like [Uloborus diversus]
MAPQQITHQDMVHKSLDRIPDSEQSRQNQESPISSPGTSSSSPVLTNEVSERNHDFALRGSSIVDGSSDDSESMPNDISGYHDDRDEFPSPLEQLKCALGKNGMLGQKLNLPYPSKENCVSRNGDSVVQAEESCLYYDSNELYKCHLCNYAGNSKHDFNLHMNSHFDHKCQHCDYTSRTEGRLKRHIKDFHSATPPESWAGTRVPRTDGSGGEQSMDDSVSSSGTGKSRTYRCKQCNFVAYKKSEFWSHHKKHIKAEKLLTCPQCEFVTEYKHHLEYHIRNHFGSKPFKCNKCNYSCVNKSMLNSHMKSHSNIYQYRCANCTYATKYCHSLKLHLRKYDHKPATVLNMDGTPNPYPIIDVYGTRRGPRSKKRKLLEEPENNSVSSSALVPSQQQMNYSPVPPLFPPSVPVMYHPQFFNGYHGNIFMRPPTQMDSAGNALTHHMSPFGPKHGSPLKCLMCDFVTDMQEVFHKHMLFHAASENQDLVKLCGINSDSILHFQDQQMAMNNFSQKQRHYLENSPRTDTNFGIQDSEPEISKDTSRRNESMYELKNVKSEENGMDTVRMENKCSIPNKEHEEKEFFRKSGDRNSDCASQETEPDEESEEKDGSFITSHTSALPKSANHHQQLEISSSTKYDSQETKNSDHAPLDLSSSKQSEQRSYENYSENRIHEDSVMEMSQNIPYRTVSTANSRNRRKGKAFKIDRNVQYQDQNLVKELSCPTLNHTTFIDDHENKNLHITKDITQSPLSQHVFNSSNSPSRNYPVTETSQCVSPKEKAFGEISKANSQECIKQDVSSNSSVINLDNGIKLSNSQSLNVPNSDECNNVSEIVPIVPKIEIDIEEETSPRDLKWSDIYICPYCDIAFKQCVMYQMHMGYHGYADPFTCNMCGQVSRDAVDFSLHILRSAHK